MIFPALLLLRSQEAHTGWPIAEGMEPLAATYPVAATGHLATPLHHAFIRSQLLSQNPKGYSSLCKVVAGAHTPEYEEIEIPTIIIVGDEDKSTPLAGCEEIHRRIGGERKGGKVLTLLKVAEGVGHWYAIECPKRVAEWVGEF